MDGHVRDTVGSTTNILEYVVICIGRSRLVFKEFEGVHVEWVSIWRVIVSGGFA